MREDDSQNQMADQYSAEMDANIGEGHHNRVMNEKLQKQLIQPGYFESAPKHQSKLK